MKKYKFLAYTSDILLSAYALLNLTTVLILVFSAERSAFSVILDTVLTFNLCFWYVCVIFAVVTLLIKIIVAKKIGVISQKFFITDIIIHIVSTLTGIAGTVYIFSEAF